MAIALYAMLPSNLLVGPRPFVPGLELVLLILIRLANQRLHDGQRSAGTGIFMLRLSHLPRSWVQRTPCLVLIVVITLVNAATLAILTDHLLYSHLSDGRELLYGAVSIWATNVLIFALWYWEIDRGAVDRRHRCRYSDDRPDFRFPQEERDKGYVPCFVDYLYLAFTNATAFSPTDAMPITAKAKLGMMFQSAISLLTVLLVAARAVNILA
jgi:hypothetical protein